MAKKGSVKSLTPGIKKPPRRLGGKLVKRGGRKAFGGEATFSAAQARGSDDQLTISQPVMASLFREARAPGNEFVVVVRKGPKAQVTAKTIGRLVNDRLSKIVRIEAVADDAASRFALEAFEPDAKAKALLRGIKQAKDDLTKAGGAYSLDEVRSLLGDISRQAVHSKVKDGAVFSVKAPGGRVGFPTVQFTASGPVKGMRELVKAFPSENPWMLLNFLIHPDDQLGDRRPIDVLKAGDVDVVVRAARTLGEQGA